MNYTTKQTQSQVQAVTSYNLATKYRRTSLRYWSYLLLLGLHLTLCLFRRIIHEDILRME